MPHPSRPRSDGVLGGVASGARAVVALCAAALLAGCAGQADPAAAPAGAAPATAPTTTGGCPVPTGPTAAWPAAVPADLPVPPGTEVESVTTDEDGLTLVRFRTPTSTRDGIVHLVSTLQPAGYALGRGDAEAVEADAPFTKGDLRGIFRMLAREPCRTDWLLALTSAPLGGEAAPLLPPPPAGTATQPLPLG